MMNPPPRSRPGWLTLLVSSLSLRLFLSLSVVIVVAFAAYAWISVRSTSAQWNQTLMQDAERFSELIKHSTHYGMLLNRKQDVHHIIQAIAETPGVEGVRIYDKAGLIMFSANRDEIGTQVNLQAEACVSCHGQAVPLASIPNSSRVRIFSNRSGRVMGLINPIENSAECSNADCHAHPPEQSILGVLDVRMSMAEADARLAAARRGATVGAIITTLLAGAFSALFILVMVRRPVHQLIRGAGRVAAGNLDTVIPNEGRNEIGQLAKAFNSMTRDLREAREALTRWSGQLEAKLRERTAELTRTQRQISHMEKMASLGKLAATVAHELNNPLAGVLNYAKLVSRTLREDELTPDERERLLRYLSLIQQEANRSGTIVRNLLTFAHRSGAKFGPHALNPIIDRSLMIVRHHMEMADIRVEASPLQGDDALQCDADQLQQALVALFINAAEAMPNSGTLRVGAEATNGEIQLTISDTGGGIPPDVLPHIFEPFFSTKEQGEGTGLGLAVVYGIVQRHKGRIEVESAVNQGTTFTITLLRHPPQVSEGEELPPSVGTPPGDPPAALPRRTT